VLAVLSVWFNVGLGVLHQRLLEPNVPVDEVASFVRAQYAVQDYAFGNDPPKVSRVRDLPRRGEIGRTYVIGGCDAVYWWGLGWLPLERTEDAGRFRFSVRFPEGRTDWQPLVTNRDGDTVQAIVVRKPSDDEVEFGFGPVFPFGPVSLSDAAEHDVVVDLDRHLRTLEVTVDGKRAASAALPNRIIGESIRPMRDVSIGTNAGQTGVADRFEGRLDRRPATRSLCREVTG
jgi:hypothetical protein